MEVLCLLALSLSVLYSLQPVDGQGVTLELNDTVVPNFGLLAHRDIDSSNDSANGNLVCRTDNTSCCTKSDNHNKTGFGAWFYPDGVMTVFNGMSQPSGQIYRMLRNAKILRLRRIGNANITNTANGIYHCEVADQNGVNQTRYVGLYTEGAGVVSISEAPQFSLISADPLEFTLTSTTTGGPPTTAEWTLPNSTVITAGDGFTQTLLNATTATFEHTLTVIGMTGVFMFSTNNTRNVAPDTSSITVQAADPPTGLTAVEASPTSILVSWTAPASGGANITQYRISYQTDGGSVQSVDVGPTDTSHTLTGLQSGATYSISIVAISDQLPSTVLGPETVTLEAATTPPAPPVTSSAPSTSPTTSPARPTVTVSVAITATGTGVAGETYSLTCTVTVVGTETAPMFEWLDRNNMTISNTTGVTITNSGRSSVLTLMSLSRVYDGSITCLATVGTVTEMNSTSVTVQNVEVTLDINGIIVPNFALLTHSDIDTSDDPEDVGGNLVCRTDNTSCCRGADGGAQGDWYYPTNDVVLFSFENPLPSGQIYRMRRGPQVVRLRRELGSTTTANGIYRCELADQSGVVRTRYVGLYTEGAGAGVVSIFQDPQFSLISEDPLEFTLTSTTTGGPPTSTFWTLPNTTIATGDPTLLNGVSAVIRHTLTVTGRMPGEYMFSTTNARSGAPDTRSITIQAANPPTGLIAVQSDANSILVSWTAPASGGASRTGYRIFYQTGGGSEQSVDVGAGVTSHTLSVQTGATYNISIEPRSNELPSARVGLVMITIEEREAPTVMTSVLGPTSIRVTFSASNAESYDIQYTRVVGPGQQLCPDNEDTMTASGVASPYDITNLQEFSSYDITVTAIFLGPTMIPTTERETTSASAPAAAPQNLIMMSTTILSTSITVGWDPVECIERNGVIDNYIVRFGPEDGVQSEQTIGTTRTHSASGLSPSTRYSFSVAAMNSAGTGPFTATLIVETSGLSPPTGLMAVQSSLTSVLVSWTAPAPDSSVITGYRITYTSDGGGSGPQSVAVTGYSTTSRTLSSLEKGAMYSITIVSVSGTSSSSVEGPMTVTVREFVAPTVATVLSPTSIKVTFTQPSVTLAAESYDIQYTRVTGAGQTLCASVQDTGATTDVQSAFTITNLEEFSSYNITVTARVFSAMRATTEQAMTSPAAPTAAPRGLTNTSITVQWDTVECIHQNGVIESYVVRYGVSASPSQRQTISVPVADPQTYTASGLTPFTRYSFEVSAVNSAGTGPFTVPPLIVTTGGNPPTAPVNVSSPSQSPTSITLSWEQPAEDFIENYIIAYTYQGGCSNYTQSGNLATVNNRSARMYTLQNLQEFSGYAITVTAVNTGGGSMSDVITASTLADAPSGPPQSVMTSSVNSSSITVQWGRVSCIDRNSEITGYTVRYGQTGSTTPVMESVSGTSDSDRVFTASGLIPHTNYTFEVAAVSSEATGPFSSGTTVETAVPEALALQLSGQRYGNNSLVTLTDIGEGDTAALLCLTDREQCCRGRYAGGDWYFPNGSQVPDGSGGVSIYRNRGASRVRLNRRNNAQSPTGVYRCEVPDVNGTKQNIYVGVYPQTSGNLTSAAIAYNGTSNSLVCTSTGGPATTVSWRKDNVVLDKSVRIFQIITNTTEATYDNVLQLNDNGNLDDIIGNYSCDVSNVKSNQDAVYTIQGLQISGHEATLQLGESYSITCTTDLEVATIEWLDSATMEVIEVGNSSPLLLELQGVDSTLNGANYTCRTTSPHGVQERSITLTVELKSPTSPIGATVGAVVGIGLVLLLLLAVILSCSIYRKKRRGKFTLFDRVRSKRGRKSQSYGVPYDVRGSGIDGAVELKGVGEEEEEGKDDDYFEDSAALAMDRKRPIPLSEFGAHVQRMHNDREKKFELEFDSLIKHPQSSVDIAQIPVNRDRNRFGNIFPYNTNRVTLNEIPGVNGSDYINASYIEGYNNTENAYIAAQGPLPNSIDDFWRMIWEQKLCTVVMLTKCFEGKAKCEKYWPENLESTLKLKNNLVISMTEVLPFTEYEIRKLKVQDTSKPSEPPLAVTQLHYTIWPDHGAPGNAMSVINFIKRVRRVHPISSSTRAPLLVHCSAGVGRTGTFIVLDVMLQRIKDVDNVNVYAFITELRTQRVFMVQSLSQYVFIHDAIDELITCGESEIAVANIRITINRLTAFRVGGMTGFQQQFQNLQRVSPKAKDVDFKVGRSAQNVSKNRYQDNVVSDLTRVRVSPAGSGCSDYINAVFVEGYRKRGAYISTQGPMEETVSDFWRMVWEYQSKCIVMLCKLEENGEESCYCYWPTQNGASAVYGKLKVTLRSQETCMDYVVRKLEVTDDKQHPGLADGGSPFVVTQFQFSRWSPTATPATFALLEVVDKMTKVQMTSGNKAITVMCNDGVGRTGAFITVHTQLERLKTEGMVDVFQSIKAARIQRAGLVQSVEQYIFCHNALEDFLDSFETYANFKELV